VKKRKKGKINKSVVESKKAYRELVRREIALLSEDDKKQFSKNIVERYMALDHYQEATDLFIYCSLKDEVSTTLLIEDALKSNKNVYLPKIISPVSKGGDMVFCKITDLSGLAPGTWGILEPDSGEMVNINELGHKVEMVVPGVCYDLTGYRIGQGGGYYDRYLKKVDKNLIHKSALAFDVQLVSKFPDAIAEPWDERIELIVSERRMISVAF